jgi:phospholipase C
LLKQILPQVLKTSVFGCNQKANLSTFYRKIQREFFPQTFQIPLSIFPPIFQLTKLATQHKLTNSTPNKFLFLFPALIFQSQINNGSMDLFAAYSNALSMSYYDMSSRYLGNVMYVLPLNLKGQLAKNGTLLDHFFHSAFGSSCLNHHWLIAGKTPYWPNAPSEMTASFSGIVEKGAVTEDGFAVNTVNSENYPRNPSEQNYIPSQSAQTVGDLLTHAGNNCIKRYQ